jgi:lipoprotein NlpD
MQKPKQNIILPIAAATLLFSCSHNAPAPVVDISSPSIINKTSKQVHPRQYSRDVSSTEKQTYLVKPGDTLFSIAWRYSRDYEALAKTNHLNAYRIYPGQQLKLTITNEEPVFSSESLLAAIDKEILDKRSKSPTQTKHSSRPAITPQKAQPSRASAVSRHRKISKITPSASIKRWIWPVNGKIINHFSAKSNQSKGLDIAGKLGTPVRATAKGRVVYSGSGLRGYGHLVIIKHNDNYLIAYAHNKKIHVEENEFVKAGQRIADLGRSGSDREKLHFEIRYKGKPVDPLNYLPKSGLL